MKRGIESVESKKEQLKIKNRESAQKSRANKKQKIKNLEEKITHLENEQVTLKFAIDLLRIEAEHFEIMLGILNAPLETLSQLKISAPLEIMTEPAPLFEETPTEHKEQPLWMMDENEGLTFDWRSTSDFPLYFTSVSEENSSSTKEENPEVKEAPQSLRFSQFLS